jgi:hypothetical protein
MDEHRVRVVLDAQAVRGLRLLVKSAGDPPGEGIVGDK